VVPLLLALALVPLRGVVVVVAVLVEVKESQTFYSKWRVDHLVPVPIPQALRCLNWSSLLVVVPPPLEVLG
jgi:hypothetical protein